MQSTDQTMATENNLSVLAEVALTATEMWGLNATSLSLIKHRENAVYELHTADDLKYAVRVHRIGYHSNEALQSEFVWMEALRDSGINVPQFLPRNSSEIFALVSHEHLAAPRQVDLLHWINGEQLGSVEDGLGENTEQISRIYAVIGKTMAHLHNHSSTWTPPAKFVRHAWDLDGLVGESPFWGRFWELEALSPERRDRVAWARDSAATQLAEIPRASSHFGMIHADLVPENILLEDGQVRIIDFDDAGFGWYLFDIATALYFIQDDPNYEVAKSALITAYREVRPLPEEDLDKLPLLMLARSFTYLGWVHTRNGQQEAQELTPLLVDMCLGAIQRYEDWLG